MQEVFYFPLKPRLKALLRTPQFRKLIEHENERPSNDDLISDIFDTPAWKSFAGAACVPVQRIILQFCIDAIPAFAAGTYSLKPAEFINLSLPPSIRGRAENILLLMLVPATMKAGQKKYFDFAARYELDNLFLNGSHVDMYMFLCANLSLLIVCSTPTQTLFLFPNFIY